MTGSSLQRALHSAKDASSTSALHPSKGVFENWFASGLDLSDRARDDITTNTTIASPVKTANGTGVDLSLSYLPSSSSKPIESASAQLLMWKKMERQKRIEQDAEEEQMQRVVKERSEELQRIDPSSSVRMSLSMNSPSSSSVMSHGGATMHVVDALVKMHGSDMTAMPSSKSKRRIKTRQLKTSTGAFRKAESCVAKKSHIAKKSKRSKY